MSRGLILYGNGDSDSGFRAGDSGCMTLSGQVLHQHHLARTEAARGPITDAQFPFSGKCDYVIPLNKLIAGELVS